MFKENERENVVTIGKVFAEYSTINFVTLIIILFGNDFDLEKGL